MKTLPEKYQILKHIIDRSDSFLLVAHARPDPDSIGSTVALREHLLSLDKKVSIVCRDPFPSSFNKFLPEYEVYSFSDIRLSDYDVLIGCDNVDRGFAQLLKDSPAKQITVTIDHHPNVIPKADLAVVDSTASSTCEILHDFFFQTDKTVSPIMADALLLGILGDTRIFHNSNTSNHTLDTVADLIDAGGRLSEMVLQAFTKKTPETLSLWGKALSNAQKVFPSGAIITALTQDDLRDIPVSMRNLKEDLKEVASFLCSVPETPFAMILLQISPDTVKASLRTEKDRNVNTALIAEQFGGGGHKLASGFEIKGKVVRQNDRWAVI